VRIILTIAAAGAIAALAGAAVAAKPPGDPTRGHVLAKTWCTGCHLIEAQEMTAKDAVPSFSAIAANKSTTIPALRAFLQTRHQNMPDWWLTRQQIDDVIAYVTSLRASSS
jgi:mono/diheme cytochrome c family protein